jgi:hypothetical protein
MNAKDILMQGGGVVAPIATALRGEGNKPAGKQRRLLFLVE